MKKFLAILLTLAIFATGCDVNVTVLGVPEVPAETEDLDGTAESAEKAENYQDAAPDIDTFMAELESIDGITDVSKDENDLITAHIEQPLDWNGGTDVTYKELLNIKYAGADLPVCYCVGGYNIDTSSSDSVLFPADYDYNAVRIEYRFYGDSLPEGVTADSADLWEYLTVENAAEDIHAIISKLGTILTGKVVMTGVSKGGFTTNFQAYKYPEDADLFVSICAPACESISDPAMYDFINYHVGDDVVGEETAAELRNIILDFQVECIRYKNDLKEDFLKLAIESVEEGENGYRQLLKEDGGARLYDLAVADLPAAVWMAQGNYLDYGSAEGIRSVLGGIVDMPADTEEEIEVKQKAVFDELVGIDSPDGYSCSFDNVLFPYTMQSAMQMGNYALDMTPLRERIASEQERNPAFPDLTITKEEEKTILCRAYLTDEQMEMASRFDFVHDELAGWQETTEAIVFMVSGAVDPWYSVSLPPCDNPNIQRVVVKSGPGSSTIGHVCIVWYYDEETMNSIYDALRGLQE